MTHKNICHLDEILATPIRIIIMSKTDIVIYIFIGVTYNTNNTTENPTME